MTAELADLAEVRAARARLDEHELTLIERARHGGATWAQIAAALGLASRQAAEQRRQRLVTAAQARRHEATSAYAPRMAAARTAVARLQRWIDTDRRWDTRFTRAALVRATVAAALQAQPGAVHALGVHVLTDLTEVDQRLLPVPVRDATAALRDALSTDH
ncbi:hypothetical protein [Polymorphospora sp. NPDC050346]|uniref:hypothetical protein n=1 Tax=Polymorphospora sp. NPDC050346 TaxID=3155780 RepID=UPI0033E788CF